MQGISASNPCVAQRSTIYPEVGLLDHMIVLFLTWGCGWRTSILFSVIAVPIYIFNRSELALYCWVGPQLRASGVSVGLPVGRASSKGVWLQSPGSPRASVTALVCGARSWALWWAGLDLRAAMDSVGLKAVSLLVGRSVSLLCYCRARGVLVLVPKMLMGGANELEALASTSVPRVEGAPQRSCSQSLCSQRELQLPPASLGGSLRSAGGFDPGSFQLLLLPWVLEHVIFCVHPLRMESRFPTVLWKSSK